ncbi:hypothetical protein J6590_060423 [Homalodisca vitripennis]|nr:hypothetical protein J6590_060423 [Homalodisca vitripennis]
MVWLSDCVCLGYDYCGVLYEEVVTTQALLYLNRVQCTLWFGSRTVFVWAMITAGFCTKRCVTLRRHNWQLGAELIDTVSRLRLRLTSGLSTSCPCPQSLSSGTLSPSSRFLRRWI